MKGSRVSLESMAAVTGLDQEAWLFELGWLGTFKAITYTV